MACFIISAGEALITTVAARVLEGREHSTAEADAGNVTGASAIIPFSRKLKWLRNMLWGGSALLAFEHVWHGEVVPWFPFLTAASDPADTAEMLHEMSTVGVAMALTVTAAWIGMVIVTSVIEKRSGATAAAEN